jgi:hypothetical protein
VADWPIRSSCSRPTGAASFPLACRSPDLPYTRIVAEWCQEAASNTGEVGAVLRHSGVTVGSIVGLTLQYLSDHDGGRHPSTTASLIHRAAEFGPIRCTTRCTKFRHSGGAQLRSTTNIELRSRVMRTLSRVPKLMLIVKRVGADSSRDSNAGVQHRSTTHPPDSAGGCPEREEAQPLGCLGLGRLAWRSISERRMCLDRVQEV